MVKSIRGDGPYLNLALPIAESTLTAIMGRESAIPARRSRGTRS